MKKKPLWNIIEQESKTDFGMLKICNEVLAAISATAALEVEGAAGTGRSVLASIKGLFSNRIYKHGAYLEFNDENELAITVYIIAKYGANLVGLASNIQSNIRNALEKMTGIVPYEINVIIQGIQPAK